MRDLIARIKRDLDVREVASAYTEVFPSGPDRQRCRCLCGQNSDRDPSVMLWGDHWHCFACGLHGSAIDLVMLVERCDFRTAVDIIRRRWLVGEDVPLTRPFRPFLPSPDKSPSPEVLAALAAAQAFYAERLWSEEGARARDYLRARGISEDTARALGLGYAPGYGTLRAFYERANIAPLVVAQAGLIQGAADDLLRERLVFPACDPSSRVRFLIGRALGDRQRPKTSARASPSTRCASGKPSSARWWSRGQWIWPRSPSGATGSTTAWWPCWARGTQALCRSSSGR
jgi:DNA primase